MPTATSQNVPEVLKQPSMTKQSQTLSVYIERKMKQTVSGVRTNFLENAWENKLSKVVTEFS